jgi:hypothetical protein
MKRKVLIAIAGLLLLSFVLARFSRGSAASPGQEFSAGDFMRIREVTRHRVWQTVPHGFSVQSIKAIPRWFHGLVTSHIRQIDVLSAGTVDVQVETSSGRYYYLVEKREKSGRWDWRVVTEGVYPQGPLVINVNGGRPYPEIRIDGGFALFGGRISAEPPANWLPPLRHPLVQKEVSASGSNQVRLTFETQPVPWEDPPGYTEPWRKVVSKTSFSASLSNAAGLNLRP